MKSLSGFFKRNSFELVMLGWVNAVRYNMTSVTIEKAVSQFYKFYDIKEDEFMKQESACRIFYRIDADLKEQLKTKKNENIKIEKSKGPGSAGSAAAPIDPVAPR